MTASQKTKNKITELKEIFKLIKEKKIKLEEIEFPIYAATLKELEEKYGK